MTAKKILLVLFTLLIVMAGLFFVMRDSLLEKAVGKGLAKVHAVSGYHATVGSQRFTGLLTIGMNELVMVNDAGDTLLNCEEMIIKPSIWRFFQGRLPVKLIQLNRMHLNLDLLEMPGSSDTLLTDTDTVSNRETNRIEQVNQLLDKVATLDGLNLMISESVFQQTFDDQTREQLQLEEFIFNDDELKIHALSFLNDSISEIHVTGNFEPSTLNTNISGRILNPTSNGLPFVKKFTGITLHADSFNLIVGNAGSNDQERKLLVSFFANNGRLSHARIGQEPVSVDSLSLALSLVTGNTKIAVIDPSVITINRLPIHFSFLAHKSDTSHYAFSLHFDSVPAQAFFESLPKGLFESLAGIKTSGALSYHLKFAINPDEPDSLQFTSHLKGHQFKIKAYGSEDFSMMNRAFQHVVRIDDRVVRSITVGPENPYFRPLTDVSQLLVQSIMICEDASFYHHKGFSEKAFRQSIATNIKQKRFARGGSTISMQLVKNVYLSRNKTISRKVEEALIVWLIENNRLVSKDRMMEVYLNIIEWGPDIYGIGEATEFYFSKKPSELTLDESIYLASIIPRPRYFKYTFDTTGTLREYLKPHFNLVTQRLVKKEIISEDAAAAMNYQVLLKGRAAEIVLPTDTLPQDSIPVEIPELILD